MRESLEFGIDKLRVTRRTTLEQLTLLGVHLEQFKGKTVLVLGPGRDFAFEKALADAGATLVVALSASFEKHKRDQDPAEVTAERPTIWPVTGYFQALPPMNQTFDFILSVYGFPYYAYEGKAKLPREKAREREERFRAIIDLLKPGGEARLTPVLMDEFGSLRKLQSEKSGLFEVESQPSSLYGADDSRAMEMAVIRKHL